MNLEKLPQAYGRNIIVKLDKSEATFSTGEVASVAQLCLEDCVEPSDMDFDCVTIDKGERVMFYHRPYTTFDFEGDNYAVIRFTDVIAKL
jgi:co-chaperonin GroES (HSP10)